MDTHLSALLSSRRAWLGPKRRVRHERRLVELMMAMASRWVQEGEPPASAPRLPEKTGPND
jgi:hypothetical protein